MRIYLDQPEIIWPEGGIHSEFSQDHKAITLSRSGDMITVRSGTAPSEAANAPGSGQVKMPGQVRFPLSLGYEDDLQVMHICRGGSRSRCRSKCRSS